MRQQPHGFDPQQAISTLDMALRQCFGVDTFRPGQREVIENILRGRDTVVVMPTGSGKSLCYQLPAMILPGLTIVVSPLIALMKDQVDGLLARGLPATFINSSLPMGVQHERLFAASQGQYKLLFVAPERFRVASFVQLLGQVRVDLFAIDEAHCISQWGHDFRPDYLQLGEARILLGSPPTIALTATATPAVRDDISVQLRIQADVMVLGFERPNLYFHTIHTANVASKIEAIASLAANAGGGGIAYCATRRQVETLAPQLAAAGLRIGMYHAGLRDADREAVQNHFMAGAFDCLVATNAFGMGVDKRDLRYVAHFNLPGSLEAYYQEAGRAGRDGEPAHCLLLYNFVDSKIHDFFIQNTHPTQDLIWAVYRLLLGQGVNKLISWTAAEITARLGVKVNEMGVGNALRLLRQAGHIERPQNLDGWVVLESLRPEQLRVNFQAIYRRADLERDRLRRMMAYAGTRRCRTYDILSYFGSREVSSQGCGHCDNCHHSSVAVATEVAITRPSAEGTKPEQALPSREPSRTVILKILSCVARLKGRGDLKTATAVLVGSRSKMTQQYHLENMSTYALLSYLRRSDVGFLIDQCHRAGLIALDRRNQVILTEAGSQIMREASAPLPPDLQRVLQQIFPLPPESNQPWRPPANIPISKSEDTLEVTRRLLLNSFDIEEIASQRSLRTSTIYKHLIALAEQRRCPDLSHLLDTALLPKVHHAMQVVGYRSLQAIKRCVGLTISTRVLSLHIAHLIQHGRNQ